MDFRKITASKIFDGYQFLEEKVLVFDAQNRLHGIVNLADAGMEVERFEGMLVPGLINCHCHLELSHMKGLIPEHTGLVDFVFAVVSQRGQNEADILKAIEQEEAAMLREGIVAVGDICNQAVTLQQKAKGNLRYYNFIEVSGWLPDVAAVRYNRAKEIFDLFTTQQKNPCSMVPHAPYSVSENLWLLLQQGFAQKTVSIHNQETIFEDQFFRHGTGDLARMYQLMQLDNRHHIPSGKTSLQSYFSRLATASKILLVHNTFTAQEDIDFIKASGKSDHVFFCLCANANLYIENQMPPVRLFRENGLQIVLGTDSLASNHQLSIAAEIQTISKAFPAIPMEELLQWATINGAIALGLDDKLGSFTAGKAPGAVELHEGFSKLVVPAGK